MTEAWDKKTPLSLLISFCLRFRAVIIVLALIIFSYGIYSSFQAKYDVFPDFASRYVQIQTEARYFTANQVAQLITQPLENVIVGTQGIKAVRSTSIQGLSVITVVFEASSDIYRNRQLVAERMATISQNLPKDVTPVMTPLTSAAGVIQTIGITSEKRSLMELRTLADWVIMPRLLASPGVANVVVLGEGVRQLQVQLSCDSLVKYQMTLPEVIAKASLATGVQGAGFVETFNQRVNVQGEGQTLTPSELGKAVVRHEEGSSVTLNDVATIANHQAPPVGAGLIQGKEGVILQIYTQYEANTIHVTQGVEKALQELSGVLKENDVVLHDDLFRAADFVDTAINNVEIALLIGAVLVAIILFVFLLNWKTVLVALVAVPLSLLSAVIILNFWGFSLNTMTLGGLAIALGLLVDDAVITVENIFRRLRESKGDGSNFKIVLQATLEVRGAVVFATLTIVLVFIPIMTMRGVAGSFFSSLSIAYILATLASLLVALTLTPSLCYFILQKDLKEPITIAWLKKGYLKLLKIIEKGALFAIGFVVVLIAAGAASVFFLTKVYLPEINEDYLIIHMDFMPGTSLSESLRIGRILTKELKKMPEIKSVAQRAGRGKEGADIFGPYQNEFDVRVQTENPQELKKKIRSLISQFPGINFSLNAFLTERINETLGGYTASFVINIFGNSTEELDLAAAEVAEGLKGIPGAVDVMMESPPGTPELTVNLRKDDLKRWGLSAVDILNNLTATQGQVVGQIYEGNQIYDVVVKLCPEDLKTPENFETLLLPAPSKNYLYLKEVADIFTSSAPTSVLHVGGRRVQTITCNISGQGVQTFTENVKNRLLSKIKLPNGFYVNLSGVAEQQKKTEWELILRSIFVSIFIILMLYMILGTAANVLLILFNIPFALVGGVFAVLMTGGVISIGSMIGFITVFGITLRNSIMIVLHGYHLVHAEGKAWNRDTIFQAAKERLAPILMTAMATGLAILPIAIENGKPGTEVEGPLAIVILGGLITSTVLNLLILPIVINRFPGFFKLPPKEKDWVS